MTEVMIDSQDPAYKIPATLLRGHQPALGMRKRVLMFHGLTTDRNEYLGFYRGIAEQLAIRGHDSLRFDTRAHGASTAPSSQLTISNMVRDGLECLKYLGRHTEAEGALSLVGTSFGAPAAIILAAAYPQLVSELFLVAPVSDFYVLYLGPTDKSRREKYRDLLTNALFHNQDYLVGDQLAFPPALVLEFATIDICSLVRRILCPVTIFHGVEDGAIPISLSRALSKECTRATLVEMEDTEHGFTRVGDDLGTDPVSVRNFDLIVNTLAG